MISVKDISCGYTETPILTDVSFDLSESKVLVLLGPNGVGKSTLLKTLAGLRNQISGSISIDGEDLRHLSIKDRAVKIAWVPQSEKVEFGWKVEEYVGIGRTTRTQNLFNTKEDMAIIEDCLHHVECWDLRFRSILELSGGELQRVRIARGLAQQASLLMLDEPTAHLDIQHQVEVLDLIRDLAGKGKTITLSLHDLNQALSLDAEYLLLHEGKTTHFKNKEEVTKTNLLNQVFSNSIEQVTRSDGSVALLPTYTTGC